MGQMGRDSKKRKRGGGNPRKPTARRQVRARDLREFDSGSSDGDDVRSGVKSAQDRDFENATDLASDPALPAENAADLKIDLAVAPENHVLTEETGVEERVEEREGSEEIEDLEASETSGREDEGEEEIEEEEEVDPSEEFATAYAKIMTRRIAEDAPGPILASKKALLASKLAEEAGESKVSSAAKQKKKEERDKNHVLPATHTDMYERTLIKIATKGVVRLFNAVSKAQRMQADAPPEKNAGKRTSAALIAELRGAVPRAPALPAGGASLAGGGSASEVPAWGVLQDKFDMGRTGMKHWDTQEGGNSGESDGNMDSEDDGGSDE